MVSLRHLCVSLALLITAGRAACAVPEGEWVSYRDAYRAMVMFEKYGKAKHLIQNQFQVMPRDGHVAPDGLHLSLHGKTISLNLPLDATGRTEFPLLKLAYDENAVLVLNRQIGQVVFRPRVSILVRPHGVYEAADLRAACEQALAFQRQVENALRGSRCAGARFVFSKGAGDPGVKLRKGELAALPAHDGAAFSGDPYQGYRVVDYRFEAGDKGQVVTENVPLAIVPLYE
jgi:hypothetical protein